MADNYDEYNDATRVKTLEETDKKCPSCGGTMDFDPKTGGLSCPYCGHTEAIEVKQDEPQKAVELSLDDAENTANCDWGVAKKTVICKSCGAESVYDANEISSVCPYCGSNQVMEANDTNTMAPGGVVPFKIDEKGAAARFTSWIKGKFFCPKKAKESAKAKNFKGVYLPYWTFDAKTVSKYTAEYGKDKKVKKGDQEEIVTDWFHTNGIYNKDFDDELVCGTTRHNTGMLGAIEPYDTEDNKVYKPEYVAGFAAERYSLGVKAAWEKAKKSMDGKIYSSIASKIRSQYDADHVRNLKISSTFSDLTYKYLLLPVWLSSFKYNDKVYQFMVNGQTGKVSGEAPVSIPKVILTILGVIIACVIIYNLMFN